MTKTNFKWKFTAFYNDGSSYHQTADDQSRTTPGQSSYHDVDQSKLERFTLNNSPNYFSLNLRNCEFTTNAGKFKLHTEEPLINVKLVYYRHLSFPLTEQADAPVDVRYILGFQADNTDGRPVYHHLTIV